MNQLGIEVDTFGNGNFNPSLPVLKDKLLPASRATFTLANLDASTPLDNTQRYVVRTMSNGATVAFVGMLRWARAGQGRC